MDTESDDIYFEEIFDVFDIENEEIEKIVEKIIDKDGKENTK
jgi:hypothetical protein